MPRRRSNIVTLDLTTAAAKRILAEVETSRIFFTQHAKDRMRQRGISTTQALRCLRNGSIVEGPARDTGGEWKVTVEVLTAGTPVSVVAAIEEDSSGNHVIVVTVFS